MSWLLGLETYPSQTPIHLVIRALYMPVRTYILILQPVPRGVKGLVTCNAEVIAGDADGDQVLDAEELALDGAVGDGLPAAQAGAEDFDAFLALAVGGGC